MAESINVVSSKYLNSCLFQLVERKEFEAKEIIMKKTFLSKINRKLNFLPIRKNMKRKLLLFDKPTFFCLKRVAMLILLDLCFNLIAFKKHVKFHLFCVVKHNHNKRKGGIIFHQLNPFQGIQFHIYLLRKFYKLFNNYNIYTTKM